MRTYTAEQTAARLEYTRQWRKRNQDKIRANELRYAKRRTKLARARRRAKRDLIRSQNRAWRLRNRKLLAARRRAYAAKRLAADPNWNRERMQRFIEKNPRYWSEIAKRRRLRLAWLKFTRAKISTTNATP